MRTSDGDVAGLEVLGHGFCASAGFRFGVGGAWDAGDAERDVGVVSGVV